VEAVEQSEREALIAAGVDEYAATCALRTEKDGGFCHAYFYTDGQWHFQTGGHDLTLKDGSVLRCLLAKRLYAHPPATPDDVTALRDFVFDFEAEFCIEGVIVDDPDPMLKLHYIRAIAALTKGAEHVS
jgi:hypothetical protein